MEHSSGLKRMHQIWKGICQSMFHLTKKLYSATIQKVLAHFAVQAECIAEGTQHTGSFHKKEGQGHPEEKPRKKRESDLQR